MQRDRVAVERHGEFIALLGPRLLGRYSDGGPSLHRSGWRDRQRRARLRRQRRQKVERRREAMALVDHPRAA